VPPGPDAARAGTGDGAAEVARGAVVAAEAPVARDGAGGMAPAIVRVATGAAPEPDPMPGAGDFVGPGAAAPIPAAAVPAPPGASPAAARRTGRSAQGTVTPNSRISRSRYVLCSPSARAVRVRLPPHWQRVDSMSRRLNSETAP